MNYYDKNAEEFFNSTVNADMSIHYDNFLNSLPENAVILDAGCGSGRDVKMFKELGFSVEAIDASSEMCKLAEKYSGIKVKHMKFQDMSFTEEFNGIWASASLLHLTTDDLELALDKLYESLKKDGIIYASFKYGNYEGLRNGRFFNDLTESDAITLFEKHHFRIMNTWITEDVRKGRENEKWTNILVRK